MTARNEGLIDLAEVSAEFTAIILEEEGQNTGFDLFNINDQGVSCIDDTGPLIDQAAILPAQAHYVGSAGQTLNAHIEVSFGQSGKDAHGRACITS